MAALPPFILYSADPPGATTEHFGGRDLLVYKPRNIPSRPSAMPLVVVLHGGLGNAFRIERGLAEKGLKLDDLAEKNGFLVAYLNGTPVTRLLGADKLGWNAGGGCCGVPAQTGVDDVGYISGAVGDLVRRYGADPRRVYGIGHSNGAMMTLRLMCETNLYAAAISISGPLNLDVQNCPGAKGKRVLAIHGSEDRNVPVAGGKGSQSLSRLDYRSERDTQRIFVGSGADFGLMIVPGAGHMLDDINRGVERLEGVSIARKAALFFGLGSQ